MKWNLQEWGFIKCEDKDWASKIQSDVCGFIGMPGVKCDVAVTLFFYLARTSQVIGMELISVFFQEHNDWSVWEVIIYQIYHLIIYALRYPLIGIAV